MNVMLRQCDVLWEIWICVLILQALLSSHLPHYHDMMTKEGRCLLAVVRCLWPTWWMNLFHNFCLVCCHGGHGGHGYFCFLKGMKISREQNSCLQGFLTSSPSGQSVDSAELLEFSQVWIVSPPDCCGRAGLCIFALICWPVALWAEHSCGHCANASLLCPPTGVPIGMWLQGKQIFTLEVVDILKKRVHRASPCLSSVFQLSMRAFYSVPKPEKV